MSALSPTTSPKQFRRRGSTRRRAGSHLETHDTALHAIRSFLRGHTAYEAFPVSFRLIVLDTKLNVKKALQCLLLNGLSPCVPLHKADFVSRCRFCSPLE
jgi:5'-AMP-activated protein kinase regulatory gamma subunit